MFINVQTNRPKSQNSAIERLATLVSVISEIRLVIKSVTKCHWSEAPTVVLGTGRELLLYYAALRRSYQILLKVFHFNMVKAT